MPRRTVMIDDDLNAKLRKIHARKIRESKGNVSFNKVVNEILKEAL